MQMPRHSDEAKDYFRSLVSPSDSVEVRPMFGSVAAFVNGSMYAGLFGDDIGVKLDADGLRELADLPGTAPFGPRERPVGGFLSLPAELPDAAKQAWMERARDHVASLPPKVKRTGSSPRRSRTPGRTT